MSILLSDEELAHIEVEDTNDDALEVSTCTSCQRIVAKATAIHAVQYLEGECPHADSRGVAPRRIVDCPDCMKQIHEEIEQ